MYGKICESYVCRVHETVVFVLNLRVSTRYTAVEFKVLIELLDREDIFAKTNAYKPSRSIKFYYSHLVYFFVPSNKLCQSVSPDGAAAAAAAP